MARFFVSDEATINTDEIILIRPFTDEVTEVVLTGGECQRFDEPYDSFLARMIQKEKS